MRHAVFGPSELEYGKWIVLGVLADEELACDLGRTDSIILPIDQIEAFKGELEWDGLYIREAWAAWEAGDDSHYQADRAFMADVAKMQEDHEKRLWRSRGIKMKTNEEFVRDRLGS